MDTVEFVLAVIIIVAAIGLYIYNTVRSFNNNTLTSLVKTAIIEAEKYLGSSTGTYKLNYAISYIYERMPNIIKQFISVKKIEDLIEEEVYYLNNFLLDGGDLSGYDTKKAEETTSETNQEN
jgi:hypothetical protein